MRNTSIRSACIAKGAKRRGRGLLEPRARDHEVGCNRPGLYKRGDKQGSVRVASLRPSTQTMKLTPAGFTARLKYALGELYDHRSNIDITGQQQALSFKSALYAQSAVSVLEEEGSSMEAKDVDERKDLLAMSLLLRGRSLCNFALDGDSDEMSAKQVGLAAFWLDPSCILLFRPGKASKRFFVQEKPLAGHQSSHASNMCEENPSFYG